MFSTGGSRCRWHADHWHVAIIPDKPCQRVHMVVAMDDEFGANNPDRLAEAGGIDKAFVICRRQVDRRMMDHDDAEQGSQRVKHFSHAGNLPFAEPAGGHEWRRRNRARKADQRHWPAPAQIRKGLPSPNPSRLWPTWVGGRGHVGL